AYTITYVAREMSPGTLTSWAFKSSVLFTVIILLSTLILAPKSANINSVWFLEIFFSIIFVSPLAPSAANIIALLTCALATGISYVMPVNSLFCILIGGYSLLIKLIFAPISSNGIFIRFIGLF